MFQDNTTLVDETNLFSDDPLFECVALEDYNTKEKLSVHKGDTLQIWLTSSNQEWYYCGAKGDYGWIPSYLCTTSS